MKNKKSIIEKVVFATIIIVIVVLGALVVNKKEAQIKRLNSDTQNMENIVEGRDSLLNELFASFNEIENNLTYIKQKRNQLEIEQSENKFNQKESILNDIKLLDSLLENSNKQVKSLQNKLYKSNIKLVSLDKMIVELNEKIEYQNTEVAQLKQNLQEREVVIAELNTKVDGLESEVILKDQSLSEKSEVIKVQDKELNKAFLTYGSYKELKDNGVITKSGGILGIGAEKSIQKNLNEDQFMQLDIRETREIPIFSKKVEMISEHPDSSYYFKTDEGLITYLEIENPEEFWKISKYAVIELK